MWPFNRRKKIKLDTWSVFEPKAAQYNIIQNPNGLWGAEVCLFLDIPQSLNDALNCRVMVMPMAVIYESPLLVFYALQLMGDVFLNTNPTVNVIDKDKKFFGQLDLRESLDDKLGKNPGNTPKPTNEGTLSLN